MADTSAWTAGPAPAAPPADPTAAWTAGPAPGGSAMRAPGQGDDFISHAGSSTWDNVKGAFNLATGFDLWSHALESAKSGNYAEAAKAFKNIADGPAQRVADSLIDTAKVAAGHMKDAAVKLVQGDAEGSNDSANKAALHAATVLAPHAEQAAENYKQGNYGAAAGDLTGDALAWLAAKGIHAAPEAAGAAGDAIGGVSPNLKQAVGALPAPTLSEGAVALSGHPHVAAGMYAKRAIPKVWDAIRNPPPEPEPEPYTPPGTVTSTAPYAGRPVVANAEAPTPANYHSEGGTAGVISREPAAPADPANALRDGIAQGFKFKDYADAVKKGAGPTVDRLVEQQSAREAPPAGWTAGPAPTAPVSPAPAAAIPRAETLKPDVAKSLQEGAVRENPDGSRQVLTRVPINDIEPDPNGHNVIYPDVVAQYQQGAHPNQGVHPELRADNTIFEGHHRITAEVGNGKTDVLAWKPEAEAAPTVQDGHAPLAPAAAPATVLQGIDQGIARRRMPGMNYQDVDAYLASKRPPPPPPGEPGEAAAPAATQPPPASPAAPAAAAPPAPYGKQYITPGQVTKYAADNGLAEADATAALEKQGVSVVDRSSTNRVLHAIGAELGYNHATLSEIAHATYGTGLGKMTHEQMMELADKLGNEQATREPLATKRTGSPADAAIAPQAEGSPLGGVVQQLPTSEIHADPVRFQYKAGMGQGGAGDELRGVTKFDPEKSGILSVWKDPADGKTYVVNGHHRLELAQRTGAEGLTVRYIDAANAAEARAKGAMINIAEGRGTSIDAAKVFRDSGATAEDLKNQGLSLNGSIAKEGQALSNLEPNLFNQVVSGEMKPARGAMIGQVTEHADQRQLVKLLHDREASGKPMTDGQVGELLRMQAPQVTETQHSLFGDDEVSRSLIAEKAGVSDYIQSRLTQKRRTFNAVGNERAATRLAEAGNVIDADKNAAIAEATNQEHAVYQKLSTSTGPVADALDQAAKDLHAGENPAIVKVRTYAKIEPILKQEADKLTGRSSAPSQRPEGSAQAGSAQAGRGKRNPRSAAPDEDLEAPLRESIKSATRTSDLMR